MAQEGAASLPARRKRGRPRKDEALVPELSLRSQRQRINSPDPSSRDFVGQAFSGILDGPFDAGYLLRASMGGQSFKGLLFDPRLASPITAENDIAPDLPMISVGPLQPPPRHEPVPVHQSGTTAHAPFTVGAVQSTVPVPDPVTAVRVPVPDLVTAVRFPLKTEPTDLPMLALPVQRNVEAVHHVRAPMQLMGQNIVPVQTVPKIESTAAMTEKDVRLDSLVSDSQSREGVVMPPQETETGAHPKQNETGSVKLVSEHVLVAGIKSEQLDVCMGQVGTSAPDLKSMADTEMSTSRPERSKTMPIHVSMEAGPGMEFLRL